MKVLVCKQTGKEFLDLDNKSGIITTHLRGMGIKIPTSYLRRQFLKQNNQPWHYSFFELIEWEIMQKLGYDRIWDCGKFKFTLHL